MRLPPIRRLAASAPAAMALLAAACDASPAAPPAEAGAPIAVAVAGLPPLDAAREGRYAAWVVDGEGTAHPAGELRLDARGEATVATPVAGPAAFLVTVEPPGDADPGPSPLRLLAGRFEGGRAELRVAGAVTPNALQPLRERPGQFTMFTPSDNFRFGYPSHEEAGIWLFNSRPLLTEQGDMWVRLTPLSPGWVYEGWMVRDLGAPGAVWLSYGKFLPDHHGVVNTRDDTGWGPFSGVLDFRTAGEEEFPGDDWVSNPLDFPVPGGLALPLDLTERRADGTFRWTHVISIEPASDRGEPISSERPFLLRPYRDFFGDAPAGSARAVTLRPDELPRGTAEVRGRVAP